MEETQQKNAIGTYPAISTPMSTMMVHIEVMRIMIESAKETQKNTTTTTNINKQQLELSWSYDSGHSNYRELGRG